MPVLKNTVSFGTLFLLFIVLITVFYNEQHNDLQDRLKNVLLGLRLIENMEIINHPKVAVGFGACKDINFDGRLILPYKYSLDNPVHHESVDNWEKLYNSYAYYFLHGAAAEKYTSNKTFFNELLMAVSNLPDLRISIGGNAPVIARRFFYDGCDVLLGSTMTSDLKKMLPAELKVVGEEINKDDVHLVFEYKAGEQWGPYIAPRANRFIIHSDIHNPEFDSLNNFGEKLAIYQPDLLIISGIQMMDHYPISEDVKYEKFKKINHYMKSMPFLTRIHFEMASVTQKDLLSLIFENIIPYTDSIGMNEQELFNLYSILKNGNVTLATDSNPSAGNVLDKMRTVFSNIRNLKEARLFYNRKLTRLHVHTLAYQVIMVDKYADWKNTYIAVAKASLIANRYVCGSSEIDIDKAILVMDESFSISATPGSRRIFWDDRNPVSCWDEKSVHICIAPNLVCQNVKQTAGCGDNISASALAAQL